MVIQVGLHRQAAAVQGVLVVLGDAAKALVELGGGAVGGVRDLAGQCQAGGRAGTRVVVSAAPRGIQLDGADLRVCPRGLVGGRLCAGGDDDEAAHALRVRDRPFDGAVAAQGGADDDVPRVDAEEVGQEGLGADLIARRDHGEARTPGRPVRRERGRSGRSLAAAEHVRGHHEVTFGVDDASRPHDLLPPAGGRLAGRRLAVHVGVAGQRVQDQDRVGAGLVQRAPRLVGQGHAG